MESSCGDVCMNEGLMIKGLGYTSGISFSFRGTHKNQFGYYLLTKFKHIKKKIDLCTLYFFWERERYHAVRFVYYF